MVSKEDSRKYNIPIYTQSQMDSIRRAGIFLLGAAMFFSFALGYVIGHFDLQKLSGFFR